MRRKPNAHSPFGKEFNPYAHRVALFDVLLTLRACACVYSRLIHRRGSHLCTLLRPLLSLARLLPLRSWVPHLWLTVPLNLRRERTYHPPVLALDLATRLAPPIYGLDRGMTPPLPPAPVSGLQPRLASHQALASTLDIGTILVPVPVLA